VFVTTEPQTARMGESNVHTEATQERTMAVAAHPLAELLECPSEAGDLLNTSSRCIGFDAGDVVFRQSGPCKGLYVVVSGSFQRKAERLNSRVILGQVHAGGLVELAAALGDGNHTYTLSAVTSGTLLLLPIDALRGAFESYAPLRMRLLEELAREVSRAYYFCKVERVTPRRRNRVVTA
jgi:CRP-like cAMP-binding protein